MNLRLKMALAIVPLTALAACGHAHGTTSTTPSYRVSALANVPGFTDAKSNGEKMLLAAGVPLHGSATQQLAFARSMLVKSNRLALAKKLEIPSGNRQAFEAAVLDKAEHDHLATRAGRLRFADDLENLLVQYQ